VIVGAILTQNTSWTNVEKAILNLKKANLLSPAGLRKKRRIKFATLLKPSGYYNLKAKRLKNFINFLYSNHGGSIRKLSRLPTSEMRRQLLEINGIGPETRDSILLYAFGRPVFVVDAYTKRIFSRHALIKESSDYDTVQRFFMNNLPEDEMLYNEYHALIVRLGKELCRKKPNCRTCPLNWL